MKIHITESDVEVIPLIVACPGCKAQPGQPCDWKGGKGGWNIHMSRADKAFRARRKDLYGCRRCEYACDCSSRASRWLPTMTVVAVTPHK